MARTLTLVLIGVLSGILVIPGVVMLLGRDLSGDTASPQLALTLLACAILMTITGVSVAKRWPWSRRLSQVVGFAGVIAGFGGLLLFLGSSLIAAGMFPDVLLQPTNLTMALVMGLTGLIGIGLLRRLDPATAGTTGPWLVGSWHPVAAGIAIGIVAAWIWSSFVWPVLPNECCLL